MTESVVAAPASPTRRPRRTAAPVTAVVLAVAIPVIATVLLGAAPYRQILQSFPGLDVGIPTTVLLVTANLGAMLSIGALLHLLVLSPAPRERAVRVPQGFEVAVLRAASGVWAVSAGALIVFEALDSNGAPLSRLTVPGALPFLFQAGYAPTAWAISFAAGVLVFFIGFFANRWTSLLVPAWLAVIAVLAPVVSGQILVGPDHDFGGDAGLFQTLASNALFGAVGVAALRHASGRSVARPTLRRILLLASVAMPLMLVSDAVLAVFKLAGTAITASVTGWLILAGVGLLVVLGVLALLGWRLGRADRLGERGVGALLAAASIAIAGWIGVTAAMTRQPPPQYFVPTSISQVFMGFDVNDPPTVAVLFGQWRPNLLFIAISIAGVAVYLAAVQVLRRRGDHWPVGRTIAWVLGWAVVVFATSSGFGKYSAANFGVHMIVHMGLNMLAPGLLVLGGVVTLLLRASRTAPGKPAALHDWITWVLHWRVLRLVYNPLVVFVVFVGSYYALYLTPLFGDLMRFHWGHQLMNLHFLIIGYLYYSLVIGVDRPPRPLPQIGKLGYVLAAMPFHAFFGIVMMTGSTIVAENFYMYLDLPWADLQGQQYLAGGVAWAGGEIPLMIVIVILAIQWSRQDSREARRKDRHLDTGRDDEFEDYNRMLQQLSNREQTRLEPTGVRDEGPRA